MPTLVPLACIIVGGILLIRFLPTLVFWLGTVGAPEPPVTPPGPTVPPPGPTKPVEPVEPVAPVVPSVQPITAELFVVIVTDSSKITPQGLDDIGSSSTVGQALKDLNATCVTVDASLFTGSAWGAAVQRVGAPCVLITASQDSGGQAIVSGYPTRAIQDESGLIAAVQKIRAGR